MTTDNHCLGRTTFLCHFYGINKVFILKAELHIEITIQQV